MGRLRFREDGDQIDCQRMGVGGKAIPPNIDKVRVQQSPSRPSGIRKDSFFVNAERARVHNRCMHAGHAHSCFRHVCLHVHICVSQSSYGIQFTLCISHPMHGGASMTTPPCGSNPTPHAPSHGRVHSACMPHRSPLQALASPATLHRLNPAHHTPQAVHLRVQVTDIHSDAHFILLVEKDAAFMRLAEDRFYNTYPCIVLTAKGQPDVATRYAGAPSAVLFCEDARGVQEREGFAGGQGILSDCCFPLPLSLPFVPMSTTSPPSFFQRGGAYTHVCACVRLFSRMFRQRVLRRFETNASHCMLPGCF